MLFFDSLPFSITLGKSDFEHFRLIFLSLCFLTQKTSVTIDKVVTLYRGWMTNLLIIQLHILDSRVKSDNHLNGKMNKTKNFYSLNEQ